jgi:aminoglycoside 6'-N-acetyltransferase I
MPVRPMRESDLAEVNALMRALWPDYDDDMDDEQVLVFERETGGLGAFLSWSIRASAEGIASAPVPFLEGCYVAPDLRQQGVGAAMLREVEQWAIAKGFTELGSDTTADNSISLKSHAAVGFEATTRPYYFRKKLTP